MRLTNSLVIPSSESHYSHYLLHIGIPLNFDDQELKFDNYISTFVRLGNALASSAPVSGRPNK